MFAKGTGERLKNPSLLWGCLAFLFPGVGNNLKGHSPQEVNAILGGSIFLPVRVPPEKVVDEIEWNFKAKNSPTHVIGEYSGGTWKRPDLKDRFEGRLELANKTTLKIRALELEDSGIYQAAVRFDTAELPEYTFNLTVYEPVPAPHILSHLTSRAPGECNVTLQCQASATEGFNISWRRGDLRPLEEGLNAYQLSDNRRDLQLSWRHSLSDSTFTCLASNPIDEKRTSFDLLSICSDKGDRHPRSKWAFVAILALLSSCQALEPE